MNQRIFSNYETLDKNTVSFSFMIPETAADGDYQIRVLSPVIPETLRSFRVFKPAPISIDFKLNGESFIGAELVTGSLNITGVDLTGVARPLYDVLVVIGTARVALNN